MGNTCNGHSDQQINQKNIFLDCTYLPLFPQQSSLSLSNAQITRKFTKFESFSLRFPLQIQHFRCNGQNSYKLILEVQNQRNQIKTIQTKILSSQVDMQLQKYYKYMKINDMKRAAIIDKIELIEEYLKDKINVDGNDKSNVDRLLNNNVRQTNINKQIYHKVQFPTNPTTALLKYTTFTSFTDYSLKQCLYELSLYNLLTSSSPLFSHYIINNGIKKHFIMLFEPAYGTLEEIISYRRMVKMPWRDRQVGLVGKMLIQAYMGLRRVGVVHRDVRPGMVYFKEGFSSNVHNNRDNSLYHQTAKDFHFYSFMNLSSARVWQKPKTNENDDESDLLTVKGVPYYTCRQVKQAIQKNHQTTIYNPVINDIIGIKTTLLQMIVLNPSLTNNQQLNLPNLYSSLLTKLIEIFCTAIQSCSDCSTKLQIILQQINKLLGQIEPLQYQVLYDQDAGIFKDIQENVYFNHMENYMYLEELYEKTLVDLDRKEVFVPMMLGKIKKNYQDQQKYDNLEIFLRLGKYVEQSNQKNHQQFNQYYKQAFMLLISLGEQQRIEGFYKDHQRYVKDAQIVFDKLYNSNQQQNNRQSLITRQMKNINKLKSLLMREQAYMKLYEAYQYNSNDDNENNNKRLIIKQLYNKKQQQKSNQILQIINKSILHGQRSNISFEQQLSLIYCKSQLLYLLFNQHSQLQQSITLVQTALELINKNYRQFKTKNNNNCFKCKFQMLFCRLLLCRIIGENQFDRNLQKKGQNLFKIQEKFNKVQELFHVVVGNVVDLIECYIVKGDFNMVKKQMRQARRFYEKALSLVRAMNVEYKQKQQKKNNKKQVKIHKNRAISAFIQLQIVQKLIISITKQNQDILQLKKYKKFAVQLRKQTGLLRKSQKQYSRNGQPLKQQEKQKKQNIMLELSQIKEQPKEEEQHGFIKEQYKQVIQQKEENYFKRQVYQFKEIGLY